MYRVEKNTSSERVYMLEVRKIILRADWCRADWCRAVSCRTRTQLWGAFMFITLKGLPGFCLLDCFERNDFVVLDHLYLGDLLYRGRRKLRFLCTLPNAHVSIRTCFFFFF